MVVRKLRNICVFPKTVHGEGSTHAILQCTSGKDRIQSQFLFRKMSFIQTTNKQCNKHPQKLCIVIGSLKSLTDTHLLFVHMSRRRHVTQSLSLQIDSVSSPYKKLNLLTSSIIHRIALGFLFIFYFFTARYSCSPGIINWVFP